MPLGFQIIMKLTDKLWLEGIFEKFNLAINSYFIT
jgi:hypothetical protein